MLQIVPEKITLHPAVSMLDFLFARRLRNEVRRNMTGDTEPISYLQQLRFYLNRPAQIRIFVARVAGKRAGYLLLRNSGTTTFITEAVDARYRGLGVASAMVRFAQEECSELTAEILVGNQASLALHKATGFSFEGDDGHVAIYRFRQSGQSAHLYP